MEVEIGCFEVWQCDGDRLSISVRGSYRRMNIMRGDTVNVLGFGVYRVLVSRIGLSGERSLKLVKL